MADDNVALQSFDLVGGDDTIFESPKAGCNPISHLAPLQKLGDSPGGAINPLDGFLAQHHFRRARLSLGHSNNLFEGQAFPIENNRFQICLLELEIGN